jgi:hypothetical protein
VLIFFSNFFSLRVFVSLVSFVELAESCGAGPRAQTRAATSRVKAAMMTATRT